ncbi:glycosyltransferase [Microbacterium sp. X-17]|uniref:glycosyltransferase n=1 Tax=Microbacterium sp. X-17 TaxID=3144404 RepID=UPI0031F57EC6
MTRAHWRSADGVIVPLQGTSLDTHLALLGSSRRVGLWGHVASYVAPPNPVDNFVEKRQVRRADHVFAYTPHGARTALAWGAAPERVTAVMNAVDTDELEAALARVRSSQERALALPSGPFFAFIGGLDESKRVKFLAAALDILRRRGTAVHVAVAGGGTQLHDLDDAVDVGQVTLLGYLDTAHKAELLDACVGIVSPGRIGLLAVDALVAGKPILTTAWPFHAPEAEYLVEGESRLTSDDDPEAFADAMESYLSRGEFPTHEWTYPTLDGMVENFASGIAAMLDGRTQPRSV